VRMSAPGSRLPSLDGLRAISISLVLFGHIPKTAEYLHPLGRFANLSTFGVRVFFVISGYLISTLLFHEMKKTGRVSLAKFYFRRTFRIFPAFYVYVGVIVALSAMGIIALRPGDVLHGVTYTTNYHYDRAWYLGHLWSLSVEEQFYLLWPATLLLLGRDRGLLVAATFVLLAPFVRVATLKQHLSPEAGIGETFQTIGDAIATGCLLAGLQSRLEGSRRYLAFLDSPAFVLVPAFSVGLLYFSDRPSIDYTVGETMQNVGCALTINWAIRHHEGRFGRVLNSRPFVFVGTLSYSIYLWQQLFLHLVPGRIWTAFPVNLACAAAAALVSYYAVERPFLRWRERLEPRLFKRPTASPSVGN
jgi:peptidoglycan/LPS O-acetylase OafA/YrhL